MLLIAAGIICIILSLVLAKLAFLWIIGWILIALGVLLIILSYIPAAHYSGRRPWY